jgi:lipoyl synthase
MMKDRFNVAPSLPIVNHAACGPGRFPKWLHTKMPKGDLLFKTHDVINGANLHTVCVEAKCPNLLECYSKKTATFLLLGKSCTRACSFCDIAYSPNPEVDSDEPEKVAQSALQLGLKHVVLTMVARDDLSDGGASLVVKTVNAIRKKDPSATIELLTSDFQANYHALDTICGAQPEVFNHNIETVKRLTPRVRHKATYARSLEVLSYMKKNLPNGRIKSGIMVGLGESKEEVFETLDALAEVGCTIVTIGQYLQASKKKVAVKEFVPLEYYDEYKAYGEKMGISNMYVGPFIRSSYNADLFVQ